MAKRAESTLTDRLTDKIRSEIRIGRFKAGTAIPSESELCRQHQVSRVTVRRGLNLLKTEGLLESRPGVGHFVSAQGGIARFRNAARTEVLYVHNLGKSNYGLDRICAEIFAGAVEEAREHGLDVFQCCLDSARLRELIEKKFETTLRGVIFDWNDPQIARFMIDRDVPFVIAEGDFDELPVGAVVQDDAVGTNAALTHLFAHGHQSIAYIGYDDTWVHRRRRVAAFREFHLRQGINLTEDRFTFVTFEPDASGKDQALRLLSATQRPSALYVANRELLSGVLAAAHELKLRTPEDLSLVAWGAPDPGDPHSGIDHLSWDRRDMGRMAIRMLEDRAARNVGDRMQVLIPARLIKCGSVINLKSKGVNR
jgi:DNA-binding LacI/PurR family transcriptional regulator